MVGSSQLEPTAFETALMEALLDGDAPVLKTLREQYRRAQIQEREFSGSGLFLHFEVPGEDFQLDLQQLHLGDVYFESGQIPAGGEAILHVRNGRIHLLEVFSRDGSWVPEVRDFAVHYFGGSRDLEALLESVEVQT